MKNSQMSFLSWTRTGLDDQLELLGGKHLR